MRKRSLSKSIRYFLSEQFLMRNGTCQITAFSPSNAPLLPLYLSICNVHASTYLSYPPCTFIYHPKGDFNFSEPTEVSNYKVFRGFRVGLAANK